MTGKTHMICSTAAFAVLAVAKSKGFDFFGAHINPVIAFAPAAIGAWLPDMDIAQSRLGSKLKIFSKHLKHRGFTHTLVIPAILALIAATMNNPLTTLIVIVITGWLAWMLFGMKKGLILAAVLLTLTFFMPSVGSSILFGLAFGWVFHIIEDLFNSKGCPILWPLTGSHIKMPVINFIKTRHWTEVVFLVTWVGGCVLWVLLIKVGG